MPDKKASITSLEDALAEIERLQRALYRKTRDNQILSRLSENSERLRRYSEEEKTLQYLYNDLLLENCPNMIFLFDKQLRYVLGSRATYTLTGAYHSDLVNKPFRQIFNTDRVNAAWLDKMYEQNKEILLTRVPRRYDETVRLCDGTCVSLQVAISPIIDEQGMCRGTVMSVTDVSELTLAKLRAELAAQSKSRFLANMSHEIRTPMNAVLGLSELLLNEPLSETQQKYVHDIHISADSLLKIINDILDSSKIEAGRFELEPRHYHFTSMLENICSITELMAQEKGLYFEFEYTDLPACVFGDPERLRQILLNLLNNAVKYTMKGGVRFSVKADANMLFFTVADTGLGIRSEVLPLLFDPYIQVGGSETRLIEGTGLGLNIVKRLVEMMEGEVNIESTHGEGSAFHVTLPFILGDHKKLEQESLDVVTDCIWNANALLVDDNAINLNVAKGLLNLHGLSCDLAHSGEQGIALAKDNSYDIIFMDHMMPGMDGVQATASIRKLGAEYAKIPIIALTANAMPETRQMLLGAGLNDFLAKPIQVPQLCALLTRCLPGHTKTVCGPRTAAALGAPARTVDGPVPEWLSRASEIDVLDVSVGLDRVCGQKEVFATSLKLCAESIHPSLKRLRVSLQNGDFSGLRLESHSLKGSLSNIGALTLSEMAARLEEAARNDNISYLRGNFDRFADLLEKFSDNLSGVFPKGSEEAAKILGDDDRFNQGVGELEVALVAYDYDTSVRVLEDLAIYSFGENRDAMLAAVQACLQRFSYDEALEVLKK